MKSSNITAMVLGMLFSTCVLAFCNKANAHDDAMWIMVNPQYRGKDGIQCCGPKDCSKIDGREVKRVPNGWMWLGKFFEDETRGLYESQDNEWWGCKIIDETGPTGTPRCLFFPTGGS